MLDAFKSKSGATKLHMDWRTLVYNWHLAAGVAAFLLSSIFFVMGVRHGEGTDRTDERHGQKRDAQCGRYASSRSADHRRVLRGVERGPVRPLMIGL